MQAKKCQIFKSKARTIASFASKVKTVVEPIDVYFIYKEGEANSDVCILKL